LQQIASSAKIPVIDVGTMLATKLLPLGANDVLFPLILDLVPGNLSKYGHCHNLNGHARL
jgi:hypothetical protein